MRRLMPLLRAGRVRKLTCRRPSGHCRLAPYATHECPADATVWIGTQTPSRNLRPPKEDSNMSTLQNRILTKPMEKPATQPFPPRRDFASLSMHDLLDAREAYHVHLSSLQNVVATAIGRYRIQKDDWYATHSPDKRRPEEYPRVSEPR